MTRCTCNGQVRCSSCGGVVAVARTKRRKVLALGPTKADRRRAKTKCRAEVRDECSRRARGRCEYCGTWCGMDLELDHFWGRSREESVEACWMLCHDCHHEKTENKPTREHWIVTFGHHCQSLGYTEQVQKCAAALALENAQHPEHRRATP